MATKINQPATPKAARKTATPEASSKTGVGSDATSIEAANANLENGFPPQKRADLDIAHFRDRLMEEVARLEEERDYIRRSASDMDGNLPEDAEGEEETADLASSLMDKEMDMSVEEEIEETLGAIEHALQKIEDGTYGICDVSGADIPKSRLEILPWASLTAAMQSVADGE